MPWVSIHLTQGKSAEFSHRVGEIIYQTMVDTINVPPNDNSQTLTEHSEISLILDCDYLDIQRTESIVIIQITLNEGKTIEFKKAFYKHLAERLHEESNIRVEDDFISLVEANRENWLLGNGIAQSAE
jgi:hypothetical protein